MQPLTLHFLAGPRSASPKKKGKSKVTDRVGYDQCPICSEWILKEELDRHVLEETEWANCEDEPEDMLDAEAKVDHRCNMGATHGMMHDGAQRQGAKYQAPFLPPANPAQHAGDHFVWAHESTLADENAAYDEEDEDAQLSPLEGFEHMEEDDEEYMRKYREKYRTVGSSRRREDDDNSTSTPARRNANAGASSSVRKGKGRGSSQWVRGRGGKWYKKGAGRKGGGSRGRGRG